MYGCTCSQLYGSASAPIIIARRYCLHRDASRGDCTDGTSPLKFFLLYQQIKARGRFGQVHPIRDDLALAMIVLPFFSRGIIKGTSFSDRIAARATKTFRAFLRTQSRRLPKSLPYRRNSIGPRMCSDEVTDKFVRNDARGQREREREKERERDKERASERLNISGRRSERDGMQELVAGRKRRARK